MSARSAISRASVVAKRLRGTGLIATVDSTRATAGRVYVNVFADKKTAIGFVTFFVDPQRDVEITGSPAIAEMVHGLYKGDYGS